MSFIGRVGTGTANGTVASLVITLSAGAAAGTAVLGALANSSAGALVALTSVVDSKGNTWTVGGEVNNGSSTMMHMLRCQVTTPLIAGDTVTLTAAGTIPRWAAVLDNFSAINAAGTVQFATNTLGSSVNLATGAVSSPNTGEHLLYCGFALGSGRTVTAGDYYTAGPAIVETTNGTGDREVYAQWLRRQANEMSGHATQSATGGSAAAVMAVPFTTTSPTLSSKTFALWNGFQEVSILSIKRYDGATEQTLTAAEIST